jgi:hypothetical protein
MPYMSGMADPHNRHRKPGSPNYAVIAKAEGRLARADKQRARIKTDLKEEVIRAQQRVRRPKKEKAEA